MSQQRPWDFGNSGEAAPPQQYQVVQTGRGEAPAPPPQQNEQGPAWGIAPESSATPPPFPQQSGHPAGSAPSAGDPSAAGWSMFPDAPGGTPFPAGAAPDRTQVFGGTSAPAGPLRTASPPVHILGIALALAVIGIVAALLLGGLPPVAIGAWALAGPVAIGVLAWFVTTDLKARSGAVYAAQSWVRPAQVVVTVVCLIGAMVAAWRIADWVGRL